MKVHPGESDMAAVEAQKDGAGWGPLDCLRSLGRAASIASGAQPACQSIKQHADYRGFRILTSGQDGSYCARLTHWQGEAVRTDRQIKRYFDGSRFGSHEEAAQYARFVIASGALNHLGPGINAARA
jgi:hypothetical protein